MAKFMIRNHSICRPNRSIQINLGRLLLSIILLLFAGGCSKDATQIKSLTILHTNDLHDHLRTRPAGQGGLPYVSGYVEKLRSERADVILMDGGDWLEKGEYVSYVTRGRSMIEAMNRAGFDVSTVGNHDFEYGYEPLLALKELAKFPTVICNLPEGHPLEGQFPASVTLEKNGVRIGIIGVSRNFAGRQEKEELSESDFALYTGNGPQGRLFLEHTIAKVKQAAEELTGKVDLIVGLFHAGTKECLQIAESCKELQIVIGGHSGEITSEPLIVESTGALVVEAGQGGKYVGNLSLQVNLASDRVEDWSYELVSMPASEDAVDHELSAWVREQEIKNAPEGLKELGNTPVELGPTAIANLVARALDERTEAEVGLSTPRRVNGRIAAGIVDENAVFQSWVPGEDRRQVLMVDLTYEEIMLLTDQNRPGESKVPEFYMSAPSDFGPNGSYLVAVPAEDWILVLADPEGRETVFAAKTPRPYSRQVTEILSDFLANSDDSVFEQAVR